MIFRSPKWLQNILDFEISTGEDIKGAPSKRRLKKIKEKARIEAEKKIAKLWNRRWNEMYNNSLIKEEFKDFYYEKFGGFRSPFGRKWSMIYDTDFDEIKSRWENDLKLWEFFDQYLAKKKKKEQDQLRIKRELDKLYQDIINDYKNNKYWDKYKTHADAYGKVYKVVYTFENGKTVKLVGNELTYNGMIYTIGLLYKSKFVTLFNTINDDMSTSAKNRPNGSRDGHGYKSYAGKKKRNRYANPKRGLYETLMETIAQREEQLKNMSQNDPDRASLENELNVAKRQAEKIKEKYGF